MESENSEKCVQVYLKSVCKDITLFAERLNKNAYSGKRCVFYYLVPNADTNTLNMFILPEENQEVASNMDPKYISTKDMKITLEKMRSKSHVNSKIVADMCIERFIKGLLHFQMHDIEQKTRYATFFRLFSDSLSSLYIEHKICQYLQQNSGHNFGQDFPECILCQRIHLSRETCTIQAVENTDGPTHIKNSHIELLLKLKAIGYNMQGTKFVINGMEYEKGKPLLFSAIEKGDPSWIEACYAAGADLHSKYEGASVIDYTIKWNRFCKIPKFLVENGAPVTPENISQFCEKSRIAIHENDHVFLQWLVEVGLGDKEDEMLALIKAAASSCHPNCLSVLLQAATQTIIAKSTCAVELLAERASHGGRQGSLAHNYWNWGQGPQSDQAKMPNEEGRKLCLKLLLSSGVNHAKMTIRMWAILEEEESAKLLHAAGFAGFEDRLFNLETCKTKGKVVPELFQYLNRKYYAKRNPGGYPDGDVPLLSLFELCRDATRKELLKQNTRNLFKLVPMLQLPDQVKSYLLYNMSVEKTTGPLIVRGGGIKRDS